MKNHLLVAVLLCSTSFASLASNNISKNPKEPAKAPTARVKEYMCGTFNLCGTLATVCGYTPEQRTEIFMYAVEDCCGPKVITV